MKILAFLAAVVALTIWAAELKALIHDCTARLSRLVQVAESECRGLLRRSLGWLRREHSTGPQPIDVIRVLFMLALSVAAAVADYVVISNTLTVIWPGVGAGMMAISMVLLTAMVGLALHASQNVWARAFLLAVLASLVLASGILAYLRTSELVSLDPSFVSDQAETAHLVFKNQVTMKETPPAGSPVTPDRDRVTTLLPWLGALLAILFTLGETIGFSCSLRIGDGAPLSWICLFPYLLAVAVIWLLLEIMTAADISGCLSSFADVIFDALATIRSAFWRACSFWSPAATRERRRLRLYAQHRLWVESARIEALQELERRRLEAEVQQGAGSIDKVVSHLWERATELCVEAHAKYLAVLRNEQPKDTNSLDEINFASDVRLVLAKLQGRDGLDRTDGAISRRPI